MNLANLIFVGLFYSLPVFSQDLSLELANKMSARAMEYAKKKSWSISVAIVNSEGNLVSFQRGDSTYVGSIQSAIEKATSANAFRLPTSAFVEAIKSGRQGLVTGTNIVAIEGGVPISIQGSHVGAIGVSGAKAIEDEEVAKDAIKVLTELQSPQGFKIKSIEKHSIYERLGLKAEDIITSYNGIQLNNASDINSLIKAFETEKNLKLDVIRNGKPQRLDYKID